MKIPCLHRTFSVSVMAVALILIPVFAAAQAARCTSLMTPVGALPDFISSSKRPT